MTVEPRPTATWGVTLANRLPSKDWNEIRQEVYRNAGYRCQICGNSRVKMHCHEVWKFHDQKKIQRLSGFLCLCELCHDVKHFGRSVHVYRESYLKKLIEHWCKVNNKNKTDWEVYQREVRELSKKRADKDYIVKIGREILT